MKGLMGGREPTRSTSIFKSTFHGVVARHVKYFPWYVAGMAFELAVTILTHGLFSLLFLAMFSFEAATNLWIGLNRARLKTYLDKQNT